jgi:hypothetical protein
MDVQKHKLARHRLRTSAEGHCRVLAGPARRLSIGEFAEEFAELIGALGLWKDAIWKRGGCCAGRGGGLERWGGLWGSVTDGTMASKMEVGVANSRGSSLDSGFSTHFGTARWLAGRMRHNLTRLSDLFLAASSPRVCTC